MAKYSFVSTWRIFAPIDQVWEVIHATMRWPERWRGVEQVIELKRGDPDGIGGVQKYTWKSILPYRLSFEVEATRIVKPTLAEGKATGDLAGKGTWLLSQKGEITTVTYLWDVSTTRFWMNLLAPIARPFFSWNHNVIMRWGGQGLASRLKTHLLSLK
jgi:hypothetical protein